MPRLRLGGTLRVLLLVFNSRSRNAASSLAVIENFDVFRDSKPCPVPGGESVAVIHLIFLVAKKDFAAALSHQN